MALHAQFPDPTMLYRIREGIYAGDLLITAVADLDLFTWLARRGPVRAAELVDEVGLAERPTDVLLTYCAALGLIDRDVSNGDHLELTDMARQHLVAGSPYDLRSYYGSLAERPAVTELGRVLRSGEQAAWASARPTDRKSESAPVPMADWSGRLADVQFASRITAAMDARAAFLAPALAHAVENLPISNLLDVGGSSGSYASAIIAGRPDSRAAVFERAPVNEAARKLLHQRGLSDRISVITGDMFTDPLPDGYGVHLYSQVLHDWDAERVEYLLAASFAALPAGGWLIDHDSHVNADKRGPLPVAEYSVLLMHSTPGKCWSTAELREIANKVGFVDVTHRPTAGDRGILLARKPDRHA
ncbi:MAG TPA: methyltransferase [Mycobacterium sp.]|nr:methyltransferase [Mycobacterium sp.]